MVGRRRSRDEYALALEVVEVLEATEAHVAHQLPAHLVAQHRDDVHDEAELDAPAGTHVPRLQTHEARRELVVGRNLLHGLLHFRVAAMKPEALAGCGRQLSSCIRFFLNPNFVSVFFSYNLFSFL